MPDIPFVPEPDRRPFRPGHPVPSHLVCVKTEYHGRNDYISFERTGYHACYFLDLEHRTVEVHKVPEGREVPVQTPASAELFREYVDRCSAFFVAEDFVTRLRTAAAFAYLLWPHDNTPCVPHGRAWTESDPVGATVRYPAREDAPPVINSGAVDKLRSFQFPPGLYRVIRGPYLWPRHVTTETVPVVDMVCDPTVPEWTGEPVRAGMLYHSVSVSELDVVPDWESGVARLPRFPELDPDFYALVWGSAARGFDRFEFDLWGEFLVDRGGLGKWLEGNARATYNPEFFKPGFPVQHFADALHAIAYHCPGATGPVGPSHAVRLANSLREPEEKTPGRLPDPDDWGNHSHP